jgi:hypothetical protein
MKLSLRNSLRYTKDTLSVIWGKHSAIRHGKPFYKISPVIMFVFGLILSPTLEKIVEWYTTKMLSSLKVPYELVYPTVHSFSTGHFAKPF